MVNERRRVMSEDGQFPGFCLPIHQRGQTLYDSKNLSSFSYPDGILVQFKLSLSTSTILFLPWILFQIYFNKIWRGFHDRGSHGLPRFGGSITGAACPLEVGKFQKHRRVTSVLGTYRSTSSCAGGSGRVGKEESNLDHFKLDTYASREVP